MTWMPALEWNALCPSWSHLYRIVADDLHTLNVGQPAPGGAMAVVAPGTGLGEAFLTWDGSPYRPHASEGGHADFAPTNLPEAVS